jgi:arylsulfatase A-like enzyme
LDIDEETIAEVFKSAGYQTAAYGKWHNGMQAPFHPNSRGFEDYYGFCSGHWGNYYNPLLEHNGNLVRGDGFIIDDLTQHGIDFIKENTRQPFFLYLPYNTPHSPMQVPDRFWEKFKDKKLSQTGSGGPPKNQNQIDHTRAALAMCENIDWNVGRIMEQLKNSDLLENTIVIYLSDNGPNGNRWNGAMKGRKGSTDEGGVRSPMVINWPGKIPQGKIVKEIASGIDLLPTLKDLTGITFQPKNPLDGISLKPLIMQENPIWEDRYIYNYWRGKLSLRNQNYRLDHQGQLFDMVNDPNQTTDIGKTKPQVLADLSMAKEKWSQEVLVELPANDTRPFYLGHPSLQTTQVPARDATPSGNIKRSNRFPNCTYFTNWISLEDTISWEAEVAQDGEFEITIYYSCAEDAIGSLFEISFGDCKHSR